MARPCTVCRHPEREAIDKAIVGGEAFRNVAERFGTSVASLSRHRAKHLPPLILEARQAQERAHAEGLQTQAEGQRARRRAHAFDVLAELERCFERVNKLFDGLDRWLTDPEDPSRYAWGPGPRRCGSPTTSWTPRATSGSASGRCLCCSPSSKGRASTSTTRRRATPTRASC